MLTQVRTVHNSKSLLVFFLQHILGQSHVVCAESRFNSNHFSVLNFSYIYNLFGGGRFKLSIVYGLFSLKTKLFKMIYNANKILYQILQLQFEVFKLYAHFTDIFSIIRVLCG